MKRFFNNLFGTKTKKIDTDVLENLKTTPLTDESFIPTDSTKKSYTIPHLSFGCSQSAGIQRDHNEDNIFAYSMTFGKENQNQYFGLFVVADGMGGYQFGDVASNVAIRTFTSNIVKRIFPLLEGSSNSLDEPLLDIMQMAVNQTHKIVMKNAPGGGTTLTAALFLGDQVTIAHIGDSRAYTIFPDGRISLVTRDHSLVRRLEELGQLTQDEAAIFPQKNVLYRALGQGENLEADVFTIQFPKDGYLFLCSDGLWGVVSDSDISRIIISAGDPQTASQNLVAAANSAGGPDNISAIVVQLMN